MNLLDEFKNLPRIYKSIFLWVFLIILWLLIIYYFGSKGEWKENNIVLISFSILLTLLNAILGFIWTNIEDKILKLRSNENKIFDKSISFNILYVLVVNIILLVIIFSIFEFSKFLPSLRFFIKSFFGFYLLLIGWRFIKYLSLKNSQP